MKAPQILALMLAFAPALARAEEPSDRIDTAAPAYAVRVVGEGGYLGVLQHRIQFGETGTYFDYAREGGQDTLFRVGRLSVDVDVQRRHTVTFLYQPLTLQTQTLLQRDLVVDNVTFPAGTSVRLLYNFPFYRTSYTYDVSPWERTRIMLGGGLQIRNATIEFESADGSLFRTNRDVGPVPLLKVRARHDFRSGVWVGTEVDGLYAPISYLNGSDSEVVGAILDASARLGLLLPRDVEGFLNLRYLGGGAVGTSTEPEPQSDGYTKNWLQFAIVTVGMAYTF